MLEAYTLALADRTDWQVTRAVTSELPKLSQWPIDAASLRVAAGKFKRSEAEEVASDAAARQLEALPSPYDDQPERFAANRKAMRDECMAMIAANEFGQAAPGSFARECLELLERTSGDPAANVRTVLFGIRAKSTRKAYTADEIKNQVRRGDAWEGSV